MQEILLPETKPALEWVNGRALQKVSPQQKHALAQTRFASALDAWAVAHGSGLVGTEWEFRLAPPGEIRRPLVPDVAYLSFERVPYDNIADTAIPRVAPDAVIEILSPSDRPPDVEEKIRVYLASGTSVVFLVDTESQTVTIRDGSGPMVFGRDDDVRHASLPVFSMPAKNLFDSPRPLR